jgi:hypothetical protein
VIDAEKLREIGVYEREGRYYRDRLRNRNFRFDPSDPQAEQKGLLVGYDQEAIPHPVILPLATDPASIEEARQKAVAAQADFYHPQHGWLRWGRKRETEAPENLGNGAARYPTRRIVVAPADVPDEEAHSALPESAPAGPVRRRQEG